MTIWDFTCYQKPSFLIKLVSSFQRQWLYKTPMGKIWIHIIQSDNSVSQSFQIQSWLHILFQIDCIWLTCASRSNLAKSSFSIRTSSWADRVVERLVNPLTSAKSMLKKGKILILQSISFDNWMCKLFSSNLQVKDDFKVMLPLL